MAPTPAGISHEKRSPRREKPSLLAVHNSKTWNRKPLYGVISNQSFKMGRTATRADVPTSINEISCKLPGWTDERFLRCVSMSIFIKNNHAARVFNFILEFPSGDLSALTQEYNMKTTRFSYARIWILLVFVGSQVPLCGCNDDSRTTGTMVQVSEERLAHWQAKAEAYKGGPPKAKTKDATKRK